MSDLISRTGVSAWLDNMGYPKLADAVMDEDRFPSVNAIPYDSTITLNSPTIIKATSTDLISRRDAIALVIKAIHGTDNKEIQEYLFDGLRKQMWSLPSADAVEVVRCGECKHMLAYGRCMEFADDGIRPSVTDFCSYGERREL